MGKKGEAMGGAGAHVECVERRERDALARRGVRGSRGRGAERE